MSFLFGGGSVDGYRGTTRKPNPVKDMQGKLRASMRVILRESSKASQTEKRLQQEIKHYASINKIQTCQMKAKELVRLRGHTQQLLNTHCQLTSLHQNLSGIETTQAMQESIANTSKLLKKLNTDMNASQIMKMMYEYQTQNEHFHAKQEAVNDAIDDVMSAADEDSETQATVTGIFQELGLNAALLMKDSATSFDTSKSLDEDIATKLARLKVASSV